jgi:hypothetical protein
MIVRWEEEEEKKQCGQTEGLLIVLKRESTFKLILGNVLFKFLN